MSVGELEMRSSGVGAERGTYAVRAAALAFAQGSPARGAELLRDVRAVRS